MKVDKLPSSIIHQDSLCTAILDIQPVNPRHVLVIPNEHAAFLENLDGETGTQLFRIAQRTAVPLRVSGVKCEALISSWRCMLMQVFLLAKS